MVDNLLLILSLWRTLTNIPAKVFVVFCRKFAFFLYRKMACALGKNPKHREDELNQEKASSVV